VNTASSVRLQDVAEFIRGITFTPDDLVEITSPDAVACMRTKNVQSTLDLSDIWAVPKALVRRDEQLLRETDILISSANSWNLVGKACWVPKLPNAATFGGFISVLRTISKAIDPRFLYHWFSSERIQRVVRSFGQQTTNISNLNIDRCLSLTIPLPPLLEQRRIASILDKADELRIKRRLSLLLIENATRAIFLEMFGDPIKVHHNYQPLGKYLRFVTSGGRGWAKFYSRSGSRFIRSLDVQMNALRDEDAVFVTPPENAEARRTLVQPGDVLLTITGSRIGRVAPVPDDFGPAFISQHVAILRTDNSALLPIFLSNFLSLPTGGQRQIAKVQYGQTKPGLNFEQINAFRVPVPPIGEQREFCQRITRVENLERNAMASANLLESLFASLQYRAFRGEL
jgi:type I restriction enzyme S subunit